MTRFLFINFQLSWSPFSAWFHASGSRMSGLCFGGLGLLFLMEFPSVCLSILRRSFGRCITQTFLTTPSFVWLHVLGCTSHARPLVTCRNTQAFLSLRPPHRPVSSFTLARWVQWMMEEAGRCSYLGVWGTFKEDLQVAVHTVALF